MDIFIRNTPYTGPVRGVVLDWAGTAVDYGSIGPVAVFIDVFRKFGVEVTAEEARACMGLMKKDHIRCMCDMPSVAAKWESAHGRPPEEPDVDAMYRETEPMMVSVIARHSDPIPGLLETVAGFREEGIKIGSSTGYTRPMMDVLIPEAQKKGCEADAVFCSSDVPAGRPFPWMCFCNAVELEIYPMEAMVKIGDTISDIQEGLNAGMWTVGLTRSGNELGLTETESEQLPPEELQKRLMEIEHRYQAAGAHFTAEGIWQCPDIIERIEARLSQGETP